MSQARAWWEGQRRGDEPAAPDRDISGVIPEVNEARRELKAAIAEKLDASEDEQRRMADVLRKAAEEIRKTVRQAHRRHRSRLAPQTPPSRDPAARRLTPDGGGLGVSGAAGAGHPCLNVMARLADSVHNRRCAAVPWRAPSRRKSRVNAPVQGQRTD